MSNGSNGSNGLLIIAKRKYDILYIRNFLDPLEPLERLNPLIYIHLTPNGPMVPQGLNVTPIDFIPQKSLKFLSQNIECWQMIELVSLGI